MKRVEVGNITKFYCNNRVNILLRIQSLARRLRIRAKLYNNLKFNKDCPNNTDFYNKLISDHLDYAYVTNNLLNELLPKITFLSNSDAITIFSLLSRIKRPLNSIIKYPFSEISRRSNGGLDTITTKSGRIDVSSEDSIIHTDTKPTNIVSLTSKDDHDCVIKSINKLQKLIINILIKFDEDNLLTDKERYYMICGLSRECSIISIDAWIKLFKKVENVFITKTYDSLYKYLPYEIANLLLIYDQISRWATKRLSDKKSQLISTHVLGSTGYDNPLNLDIINVGINKLIQGLDQLNCDKIIKLLYLCSKKCDYAFFQHSYIHFESEKIISTMQLSKFNTVFKLYSKSYMFQLLKTIESVHHIYDVPYPKLPSDDGVQQVLYNTDYQINNIELNMLYKRVESLYLCIINIITEYIYRLGGSEKYNRMCDEILSQLFGIYNSTYDWYTLITFFRERISLSINNTNVDNNAIGCLNINMGIITQFVALNNILIKMLSNYDSEFLQVLDIHLNYFNGVYDIFTDISSVSSNC